MSKRKKEKIDYDYYYEDDLFNDFIINCWEQSDFDIDEKCKILFGSVNKAIKEFKENNEQ